MEMGVLGLWQDKGVGPKGPKLLSAHRFSWPTSKVGGPCLRAIAQWNQRLRMGPVHANARNFTELHGY